MSYQKLQGYVALEVFLCDNTNIPFPNEVARGTTTATTADELIDTNADFIVDGVKEGDIVYNTTDKTCAQVIQVTNQKIVLNADIMANGESYIIYVANPASGADDANNGCVLYVGSTGDLKVVTIAGQTVTFKSVPVGFFPVQVKKVFSTGSSAGDIIALW
mgnify:FL=1